MQRTIEFNENTEFLTGRQSQETDSLVRRNCVMGEGWGEDGDTAAAIF